MIGYGCPEPIDFEVGLSNYTEIVIIAKDNNGEAYLPEWNFNGIGDFTPGFGYQLKISESIEGFSLCGDFTAIDNSQITAIEDNNAQMQNDINCLTGNPEIGDHCYGGIVFYVEEGDEGKYGYVISPTEHDPMSWYDAMEMAENSSEGNFNNWTLPNEEQCDLIYSNIGIGSETQYLYLQNTFYWMSLEESEEYAHDYSFVEGYYFSAVPKSNDTNYSVVIVRSFGNWTMGCMDSIACNYNPDANMADGSCTYAEEGFDCEGSLLQFSMSFDGADDYLFIDPFERNGSSDITISVHAKGKGTMTCTKTPGYESYFAYNNDENGNRINFHLGILTPQSGFGWSFEEDLSLDYQFYTITLDDLGNDSTLAELFLNGVSLGQHKYPYSIPSYSFMEIGRNIVEGNGLYDGLISEIHIWDGLLNEDEIESFIICPPSGNEEGLIGYWNFNEGLDIVYDFSGNANHGTINGALHSTDVPENNCE